MCVYHIFFIYLLIDTGCFHVLVIVNSAAVNTGVHVFFSSYCFIFLREIPRNVSAGSYGSSGFNFLRNINTVFHSGDINLHS